MSSQNDYSTLSREQLIERLQELARTEDLLRHSEAQLASVLRAAPAGIGVLRDRTLLDVNPAMTTITGYAREELIGMPARTLYPSDADYAYVGTEKYRLMHEHGVGRVETRWRRKDGRVIDVHLSSTPMMADDCDGRIVFSVKDITERKRAEAALLQSEELNRSTLQALPAHIAVIGCDGRIIAVNQSWVDFARSNDAGDSPQVTVGADYLGIVRQAADREDPDAIRAVEGIGGVLNGALPQFVMEYPCHSPSKQRWFLMNVVPLSASAGSGLVISHLDITERREAEEALYESEERYRLLVSTSFDAVLLTLPDGRTLFANEAAGRMFGCSPEEVCRRGRDGVVDMTDPRVPQFIAERARNGHAQGELTFVRADGTRFPGELSSVLFRARNGEPRSSLVIRDISERKQREAERVAEMARQRDALVREVHHRIKNHLQGVIGLLREHARAHPDVAAALSEAIGQVRVIAEVFGLQGRADIERVKLCDLICLAADGIVAPVAVVCETAAPGRTAPLAQDEAVPFALVINELVTNAVKHLDPPDPAQPVRASSCIDAGGVTIEVRGGPARLPSGFDFARGLGLGTGLGLVRTLLPRQGARLEFRQEGDEVVATLRLEPPVVMPMETP